MVCLPTVTYDWFPFICVNRDGSHMWGRKCSLLSEHLISLPVKIVQDKLCNVYIMNGSNHELPKGSEIIYTEKSEQLLPMFEPIPI